MNGVKGHLIIAIDGPAGSGKSTVAREVAKRLGLLYVDTGAMYRALTLKALREKIDLDNERALVKLAKETKMELKMKDDFTLSVLLDGEDVSDEIRTALVTNKVKHVARIPNVREQMVILQRKAASGGKAVRQAVRQAVRGVVRQAHRSSNRPVLSRGAVLEGRDIGTVVFPDADKKVYLDADINERIKRRYKELKEKGHNITLEAVKEDVVTRDRTDKKRRVGPLKKAGDAILIDTTNLTVVEVAEKIIKEIEISDK